MSNCIELRNGCAVLKFHPDDVRASSLLSECRMHTREHPVPDYFQADSNSSACPTPINGPPEPTLRCFVARYFVNADVITMFRDRLEIDLGHNAHTWRDFKQTLWFISQFLERSAHFTFKIADESDGFKKTFTIPVTLIPDEWPIDTRTGEKL